MGISIDAMGCHQPSNDCNFSIHGAAAHFFFWSTTKHVTLSNPASLNLSPARVSVIRFFPPFYRSADTRLRFPLNRRLITGNGVHKSHPLWTRATSLFISEGSTYCPGRARLNTAHFLPIAHGQTVHCWGNIYSVRTQRMNRVTYSGIHVLAMHQKRSYVLRFSLQTSFFFNVCWIPHPLALELA